MDDAALFALEKDMIASLDELHATRAALANGSAHVKPLVLKDHRTRLITLCVEYTALAAEHTKATNPSLPPVTLDPDATGGYPGHLLGEGGDGDG